MYIDKNYESGFRDSLRKHGFTLKRDYGKDTYTIYKGEIIRGGGPLEKGVAEFIASLESGEYQAMEARILANKHRR
jgi:hypothetical protein